MGAKQVVIAGSGWENQVKATGSGELLVTGSVLKSAVSQIQDVLIGNDTDQLLTEILKETKKINFQLMNMTNLQIKSADIE